MQIAAIAAGNRSGHHRHISAIIQVIKVEIMDSMLVIQRLMTQTLYIGRRLLSANSIIFAMNNWVFPNARIVDTPAIVCHRRKYGECQIHICEVSILPL